VRLSKQREMDRRRSLVLAELTGNEDPTSATGRGWYRTAVKRPLARIGAGLASTGVLLTAAFYVFAPASSALTLRARDGGVAPPGTVVLYGTVRNNSGPVAAARVDVSGDSNGRFGDNGRGGGHLVGEVRTDDQGSYRLQLFVPPGAYTVDVSLPNGSAHRDFQIHLSGDQSTVTDAWEMRHASIGGAETVAFWSHGRGHPVARGNLDQWSQGGTAQIGADGDSDDVASTGDDGFDPGNHFGVVTGAQMLNLVPGVSYELSAVVSTTNLLSFLPVSSY
jgi:hypothetical protein